MKKLLLVLFVFIAISASAQNKNLNLDSLHQVWLDESKVDTVRFRAFNDFIWNRYLFSNPDTAFKLAEDLKSQAIEKNNEEWKAQALNIQGVSNSVKGNLIEAYNYFNNSLKNFEVIDNKKGIATVLGNIGIVFQSQGKTAKALDYYGQSLKIQEQLGNKKGMAITLSNIGLVYETVDQTDKALEYFFKSLNISTQLKDKHGIAGSLGNIGNIYLEIGRTKEALEYQTRSLNLKKEVGDKIGIATTMINLGNIYFDQGKSTEALYNYISSLKIHEELGNQLGIANSFLKLGKIYATKNNNSEALNYYQNALIIGQRVGSPLLLMEVYGELKIFYKQLKKGMLALEMHELEIQMRDSIQSEEVAKQIAQTESRVEFEKELLIQEQEEKEAARIEAEKVSRRNTIQYSGIGLGIFALFGLVFLFGRIQLPNWAVELSVFLPFLILFEFLLVITDPYVDAWSGGEPLIKLGLNVILAAMIFPMHSIMERFLKQRLFKTS